MRRFDKKYNIQKANLLAEQRYLESKGLIKEEKLNEDYDLVSQFMEKNEFLNSLGLDENGIKTLEGWINLLRVDDNWCNDNFPMGTNFSKLISYISKKVKDLPSFIMKYKDVNPMKVVNFLKRK